MLTKVVSLYRAICQRTENDLHLKMICLEPTNFI
jgi:hypothetical protein